MGVRGADCESLARKRAGRAVSRPGRRGFAGAARDRFAGTIDRIGEREAMRVGLVLAGVAVLTTWAMRPPPLSAAQAACAAANTGR